MIQALIIEDTKEKRDLIKAEISNYFSGIDVKFTLADTLHAAIKAIFETRFDLIVADLLLPRRNQDIETDVSDEIVVHIQDSSKNSKSVVVAISQFSDLVEERRKKFVDAGIILVHFDEDVGSWRGSLNVVLQKIERKIRYDFVIVCALEKERSAFRQSSATVGDLEMIAEMDCLHVEIGKLKGLCIRPPRMGLVDASIISARAIEVFEPRLICMAGICAGFSEEVEIGTLIVSDVCWEHQAGKWSDNTFKLEHYDISLENEVRVRLSQFIERNAPFTELRSDQDGEDEILSQPIVLKPTVTGSAVIASEQRVSEIKEQHRKLSGLDMEMYGLYRARELSMSKPICFGAKTVVDLADSAKGDDVHQYGAVFSARFVVDAVRELLNDIR